MESSSKIQIVVAAVVLLLSITGGASAQTGEVSPGSLSPEGRELEGLDERIEGLSLAEFTARAESRLEEMRARLGDVEGLLERARQDQKLAQVNCINERFATMQGLVKVSEESFESLDGAIAESDREAAEHHFRLIAVAGRRVSRLASEAQMCTGQVEQPEEGEGSVSLTVRDEMLRDRERENGAQKEGFGGDPGGIEDFDMTPLPAMTPFQ